jgi:hypothetical protein
MFRSYCTLPEVGTQYRDCHGTGARHSPVPGSWLRDPLPGCTLLIEVHCYALSHSSPYYNSIIFAHISVSKMTMPLPEVFPFVALASCWVYPGILETVPCFEIHENMVDMPHRGPALLSLQSRRIQSCLNLNSQVRPR